MNYLMALKFVFSATLLITFLLFFGLPSWNKYQAKTVMVNRRKISSKGLSPPAITFCAIQQDQGWKNAINQADGEYQSEDEYQSDEYQSDEYQSDEYQSDEYQSDEYHSDTNQSEYHSDEYQSDEHQSEYQSDEYISEIFYQCNESSSFEDTVACIDTGTFNLTETVQLAVQGISLYNTTDISDPAFWINDVTPYGKCHTLNNSATLGPSKWFFGFGHYDYNVYVHDPNFFMITDNPVSIPKLSLDLKPQHSGQLIYISVIEHIKMDRAQEPCEEREEYSFTACVKNSVSRKVGCRLPWDTWTSPSLPVCTTNDQVLGHEKENYQLMDVVQADLINMTGCSLPCRYREYKSVGSPKASSGYGYGIQVSLAKTEVAEEEEALVYEFVSFVSEFGGALGLFLGLSFLSSWDLIEIFIAALYKRKN